MRLLLRLILSLSFFPTAVAHGKASDLSLLNQARRHYSKGRLERALSLYDQIGNESEYWLEALEERSATYGRQGHYDKALADLQTLFAPQFEGRVGPNPYALQAITQLKICDYKGVLDTNKKFKTGFRTRISDLEALRSSEQSSTLDQVVAIAKSQALTEESLGPILKKLPRQALRDHRVAQHSRRLQTKGTHERHLRIRLRYLAKLELQEIANVIDKLQIAEAEVIHRVNALTADSGRVRQGEIEKSNDVLVFPASEEVWFDELGQFQTSVERCPTMKRRVSL